MRSPTLRHRKVLTPSERRQRNRDEMAAAILDTARAIMREEGVAALNLNEVARRLGMKTPSLYEYFDGKAAIYDHLFRLGMRLFSERMRAFDNRRPSWAVIAAGLRGTLEFALDYPELYQLCFQRHVPRWEPSPAAMDESLASLSVLGRHVQTWLDAGLLRTRLPPEQVRDLIIALSYGISAQHLANEPHLPAGSGRFGALIPPAIALLKSAWGAPAGQRAPARRKKRIGNVKEKHDGTGKPDRE